MRYFPFFSRCLALSTILATLSGCAAPSRLSAVPPERQAGAEIPGMAGVRYCPLRPSDLDAMIREGRQAFSKEMAYLASIGHQGPIPPATFLAVSGGGDDGAFGAGLLNGWTSSGSRPEFKLVTGVSTGALIAPFAFLGPSYDHVLREVYTQVSPTDIAERRGILAAFFNDALADNAPLLNLVRKHVDQKLLDAVAAEYGKGRLLLVATTNLDTRLPVIWNLTKIAASGHPQALELFQKLMVASAAIPGAFPPTLIDVEANGKPHQEMHVDGGATSQVFLYPPSLKLRKVTTENGIERERILFVIRNARLDPDWAQVERRTLNILQRAISSLIQTQGVGDLFRIYAIAQRDGLDYNLAFIPSSFNAPRREDFDPEYMRSLFDVGYQLAAKGYPWLKTPPNFTQSATASEENPNLSPCPVQDIHRSSSISRKAIQ